MGRQHLLPQWQLRSSYLCTCRRLHWLCCFAGIEFLLGVQKNLILRSNGRTPTQNGHMCHKVSTATIIAVSIPQVSHGMLRAQGPNVKALTSKQTQHKDSVSAHQLCMVDGFLVCLCVDFDATVQFVRTRQTNLTTKQPISRLHDKHILRPFHASNTIFSTTEDFG